MSCFFTRAMEHAARLHSKTFVDAFKIVVFGGLSKDPVSGALASVGQVSGCTQKIAARKSSLSPDHRALRHARALASRPLFPVESPCLPISLWSNCYRPTVHMRQPLFIGYRTPRSLAPVDPCLQLGIYDAVSNAWSFANVGTPQAPEPGPRAMHAAAALQGTVFITGGEAPGGEAMADIQALDSRAMQWYDATPTSGLIARSGHVAAMVPGAVLVSRLSS